MILDRQNRTREIQFTKFGLADPPKAFTGHWQLYSISEPSLEKSKDSEAVTKSTLCLIEMCREE